MDRLGWGIQKLIYGSELRSYAARRAREIRLHDFAKFIGERWPGTKIGNLGKRHFDEYLKTLFSKSRSSGTQKNYLTHLRWLAGQIGKQNVIPRDNAELGITSRTYYATQNRAAFLAEEQIAAIPLEAMRLSVELQQLFGLRAQEALKFRVKLADRGNYISLLGSWCKNGRPRNVDVKSEAQRELLRKIHEYADRTGNKSLISQEKSLKEWLRSYHYHLKTIGIKSHGLRHEFAHRRYEEITGLKSRVAGGPSFSEMTKEQQAKADLATKLISDALGHSRKYVASMYLGKRRG